MALWLVRAGKRGETEAFCLENKVAAVGWDEVPDLTSLDNRATLLQHLSTIYSEKSRNALINWASELWAFAKEMKEGDLVALPSKREPKIHFGTVTGPYRYVPDNPPGAKHTRPVQWLKTIPRAALDQDLLYSLGSSLTVAQIQRNNAEERVRDLLVNGGDVKNGNGTEKLNLEELARDAIRDYLNRRFKGHALARLVEGILQAQGYRTFLSPTGPDGGVDILAGSGPLGFESPRIAVQVKSGDAPIGTKELNELRGAMKKFGANYGLFVSWGGFKETAKKEKPTSYFEIRLWDSEDLILHLLESYERLPEELKAELPLKRIWILVEDEEST
ncbi:restriction endonuclease [Thermus scotoductus]|uniref:Restriction endonuclease n=1 Tax=Thermus scotoductus (strain ATCC 700910 / SA-01) TaxID=743525 RepID=E8PMG2_THESS|nr:restriction endonuclease [Thermus scotoductus]ADW22503.1 restriction endonuclease [Thermus scotoductus SA-01]ETN88940.1 restriction endonuclease [Thermus sp. NMX2.A1]